MIARIIALGALFVLGLGAQAQTDPLPSWNDGPAKKAIVEFVQATTSQGSPRFVPPPERIATFDQRRHTLQARSAPSPRRCTTRRRRRAGSSSA